MKKALTAAVLSSVLVLGLASSALAVHATETAETPQVAKGASKIPITGSVRERGYYGKDKDSVGGTGYDSRVKLGVGTQAPVVPTGQWHVEGEVVGRGGIENTGVTGYDSRGQLGWGIHKSKNPGQTTGSIKLEKQQRHKRH